MSEEYMIFTGLNRSTVAQFVTSRGHHVRFPEEGNDLDVSSIAEPDVWINLPVDKVVVLDGDTLRVQDNPPVPPPDEPGE